MILSLLTRRVGRVLIENIVYHKDKIALKIVYDDSKGDVYFVGENTISLRQKNTLLSFFSQTPDAHENGSKAYIGGSKKTYHLNPPEIILAHEMIHHLHYIENSPVIFSPPKPTLGNFTDQEEQETISGLKTFLSIEESKEIAHNIEDDQNFGVFKAYDQSKTWDEINENSFLPPLENPLESVMTVISGILRAKSLWKNIPLQHAQKALWSLRFYTTTMIGQEKF